MTGAILALILALWPQAAQTANLPHAFPREGAKQLFDNDRVTVWEVIWAKGRPTPMHRHRYDMVGIELADATVKGTNLEGVVTNGSRRVGQVGFTRKGLTHMDEGTSDVPRRMILIDLKDVVVPPLSNTSGYPDAFPREAVTKRIDNERVTVWDFSWTPGKPTVTHFHSKDVVVVYLGDGDLSSTTPEGKTVVNSYTFGQAKFNPRDRTHSELLVRGMQRIIAVELK